MADTVFHLNRVDSRVGPIALVTLDNGEDYRKPTTLGRSALESLVVLLDELESGDWAAMVLTGKPFVFCVGADIDEFTQVRTAEDALVGTRAGPRALRPHPRAAVPDRRGDQRRVPRRRARARTALRRAHDRVERPSRRLPRGLPLDHSRVGRHAARAEARRPGSRDQADRREPAASEQAAVGIRDVRARARRPRCSQPVEFLDESLAVRSRARRLGRPRARRAATGRSSRRCCARRGRASTTRCTVRRGRPTSRST